MKRRNTLRMYFKRTVAGLVSLTAAMILLEVCISTAWAQAQPKADPAYPTRPIRFIVPTPPGSGSDVLARVIASKLGDAMGQPWVVENRSGAGGNIGAEVVVRASPDGYMVLFAWDTMVTANQTLYKLPFSVEKDLQPIMMIASSDLMVVTNPKLPVKTLREFVDLARQKPGMLNYASAGLGTPIHLGTELLLRRLDIKVVHVAYKGGGPAAASVISGDTQLLVNSIPGAIPYVSSGQQRALASTGSRRSKLAPDVPTVAESGYPGFELNLWYALFAPGGTPTGIVHRIHEEFAKRLLDPDVRAALERLGVEVRASTPEELAARIKSETTIWADVIKGAGIRAE